MAKDDDTSKPKPKAEPASDAAAALEAFQAGEIGWREYLTRAKGR